MKMTPRKLALQAIKATGKVEGINRRTVDALMAKGHIKATAAGWELTKRGESLLAGRLGNAGNLTRMWEGKARTEATKHARKGAKPVRTSAATKKRQKATAEQSLKRHIQRGAAMDAAALRKVLGPTGHAQAVKVSLTNGEPFDFRHVDAFEEAGWKVEGAGSVAARPGLGRLAGVVNNPAPLGANGTARALILVGPVDRDTVHALRRDGLDIAAAPKRYREAPTRNPGGNDTAKRVYALIKKATDKGQAWNAEELANRLKLDMETVAAGIRSLVRGGLIHEAGRDMFGSVYLAGTPQRGLFANPGKPTKAKAARIARKKAEAWFWEKDELTEPMELQGYHPPTSGILVGEIVAIEYRSRKDGTAKVYRHDVTKKRDLIISVDGSTLIINPAFKITKRGIEG